MNKTLNKVFTTEREGQLHFFKNFGINLDEDNVLVANTDGVYNGNIFEFKLNINNTQQVLFQAIKYLSRLRIAGCPVPKNILLVSDESATDQKRIIYSYIKMIRGNDQGECIIQNFYEEHSLVEKFVDMPLTYVNTCTVLSDSIYNSCEPLFIQQDRKNRDSDAAYKEEPAKEQSN